MQSVAKGVLKAKMLEYFRRVEETGEELIVTDNRKPVLKITRLEDPSASVDDAFRHLRGKVKYYEDVTAPTTDEWGEV